MAIHPRAVRFLLFRDLVTPWLRSKRRVGAGIGVLIPVAGVAVGVFAFVVVLSVMAGFVANIKSQILSMQAHIQIVASNPSNQIPQSPALLRKISSLSGEIINVAPYQGGDVILQVGSQALMAQLEGIDPSSARQTLDIEKYLSPKGTSLEALGALMRAKDIPQSDLFPTIMMSQKIMDQLGVDIGDRITLLSTQPDEGPGGLSPLQFPVVVAGAIDSNGFAYSPRLVLCSLDTANRFLQLNDSWEGVQVRVKHPLEAEKIAEKLNVSLLPIGFRAKPWTESNHALLSALQLEHWAMTLVMFMIVLVGCFSISISLLLSVRRKSFEMAMLRSMGCEQKDLGRLFLWQGLSIGSAGVTLGLLSGGVVLYILSHYQIPFVTDPYSSAPLPIRINFTDLLLISGGSVVLAMISAVWPALEVRKLNVIEVLSMRH